MNAMLFKDLNPSSVLLLPDDEPEKLTRKDVAEVFFLDQIKKWHPDVCSHPQAKDMFIKLRTLQKSAIEKIKKGTWQVPGQATFHISEIGDPKELLFRYVHKRPFELGTQYIANHNIVWDFKTEFYDFWKKLDGGMSFNWANPNMKKDFEQLLPFVAQTKRHSTGFLLIMKRPENSYPLRDVLTKLGGSIDPKHVAWIINRLYSIACYLQWASLTHNNISLDTVWVNPEKHWCYLLGGWPYSAKAGTALSVLPTRTVSNLAPETKREKKAIHKTDLNLIRLLAREVLSSTDLPKPMASWLKYTSTGDAFKDFESWQKVLTDSFGARRFVELKVDMSDFYN